MNESNQQVILINNTFINEKSLLTFLKQTKDGKFAKIEESSLPYIRIQEQREETFYEEDYYYSMR